ncbi:reverse transcriptase, partial [Tanacetum coccineum]
EAVKKKNKPIRSFTSNKFNNGGSYGGASKPALLPKPNTPVNTTVNAPIRKQLSQKEYQDKRAQNLCFYCDQKYAPGHKCAGQLFSLILVPQEEEDCFEDCLEEENMEVSQELPQISLHAMNGVQNYRTLRVRGTVGKHIIHILVDCESTHNFVDIAVAKKLGCHIKSICPLSVTVGDGYKVATTSECKQFNWQLQGVNFCSDVMLLPLVGCEMILGIQWLSTLGDIKCNFKELRMEFVYKRKKMVLRGTPKSNSECLMRMEGISAELQPELQSVVEEFGDVFVVPKELPPSRPCDHRIPLLEGTNPINIRPYRHPPTQKEAIESMVQELLDTRVIRKSHSPFASPIVMVKKRQYLEDVCRLQTAEQEHHQR